MYTRHVLLTAFAVLSASACGPHRFPGTEIEDNADTRAVRATVEAYRIAMEKRDAAALLALTSPDYLDNAGTPEAKDDLDRKALETQLPKDLAGLEGLRVDLTLRRIDVKEDTAIAEVFFEQFYKVTTATGPVPRRDADVHRFRLKRTGGKWLFLSGL
jgi:ketosteroid isomerase-like protein